MSLFLLMSPEPSVLSVCTLTDVGTYESLEKYLTVGIFESFTGPTRGCGGVSWLHSQWTT